MRKWLPIQKLPGRDEVLPFALCLARRPRVAEALAEAQALL